MEEDAPRYVIDAGALLAAFLPEEKWEDKADSLLDAYQAGKIKLCAPSLILYEVTNGLYMAVRGKAGSPARITPEEAKEALKFFLDLGITLYDGEELVEEAFTLSLKHRWRSVYDMVYLSLARALGVKLITAEKNLAKRGGKDVWPIWDFDEAHL